MDKLICKCSAFFLLSEERLKYFPESAFNGLCDECFWNNMEKEIDEMETEIVILKYEIAEKTQK